MLWTQPPATFKALTLHFTWTVQKYTLTSSLVQEKKPHSSHCYYFLCSLVFVSVRAHGDRYVDILCVIMYFTRILSLMQFCLK